MTMCNNGISASQLWELIDELADYVGPDVADEVVLTMVRGSPQNSEKIVR